MTKKTASPEQAPPAPNPRVIYVDDEDALVEVLSRMLQRRGYVVEGFTDAERALETFRADPARIRVVVTDLTMPRMSGLDLARELMAVSPGVCIILTSGYVNDDLVRNCREAGIRHVIYKSSTVKELCEHLDNVLRGECAQAT